MAVTRAGCGMCVAYSCADACIRPGKLRILAKLARSVLNSGKHSIFEVAAVTRQSCRHADQMHRESASRLGSSARAAVLAAGWSLYPGAQRLTRAQAKVGAHLSSSSTARGVYLFTRPCRSRLLAPISTSTSTCPPSARAAHTTRSLLPNNHVLKY